MVLDLEREGSFGSINFPEAVLRIQQQGKTGMLRAERDDVIKVIYFRDGEISFASSNEESDRLGHVFMRAGKLTEQQLDAAMSKVDAKTSLGKTFISLGYITPKELLWGARKQVEDILLSLYYWRDGRYQFIEGPLPKKIANLRLPTSQVVARTIQLVADRDWILERLGSLDTVFSTRKGAFEDIKQLDLGDEVEIIVAKVDGTRSVRDVCSLSRMDDFTVSKVLYALHLLGMLEVERDPEAAAEPFAEEESEADPMGLSSLSDDMNFSDLFSDDEPRREPSPKATAPTPAQPDALSGAETVQFSLSDVQLDAGNETMTISPAEAAALRSRAASVGRSRSQPAEPAIQLHEEETIALPSEPAAAPAREDEGAEGDEDVELGETSFRDLFQEPAEEPSADAMDDLRFETEPEPPIDDAGPGEEPAPAYQLALSGGASEEESPEAVPDEHGTLGVPAFSEEEEVEIRYEEDPAIPSSISDDESMAEVRDEPTFVSERAASPWDEVDSEATYVPAAAGVAAAAGISAAASASAMAAKDEDDDLPLSFDDDEDATMVKERSDLRGASAAPPARMPAPPAPPVPPPPVTPPPARIPHIPDADFADLFKDDPTGSRASARAETIPVASPPPRGGSGGAPPEPLLAAPKPAAPPRPVPRPAARPAAQTPARRSLAMPLLLGGVILVAVVATFLYLNWEILKPSLPPSIVNLISGPEPVPTPTVEPTPPPTSPPVETTGEAPPDAPATVPDGGEPSPIPDAPTLTPEPIASPSPSPTTKPTPPKATPAATPSPEPTKAPSPTPAVLAGSAQEAHKKGHDLAAEGKFVEAARVFRMITLDKTAPRYSIQLELDCQTSSLQDAIRNGGGDKSLFFVPRVLKGRSCFLVLWGLYPSPDAASSGMESLPGALVHSGAKPRVVRLDALP